MPFEYAPAPESRAIVDLKSSYGLFIDGDFVDGRGHSFKSVSPATEEVLAEISEASAADVDLAVKAAQQALERANLVPEDVDFIAVGTTTPDMIFPSVANIVQHRLGCRRAGSIDLLAACAGSIYSLSIGSQFIQTGKYKHVLCIGAETLSKITDFTDRGTCVLEVQAHCARVYERGGLECNRW